MIEELRIIFKLRTYAKLAELLGVKPETLILWKSKEKRGKLPGNIEGLMSMVLRQQKEILKLKEGN